MMLQGEKVRLREVRETDLVHFLRFVNDPEVTRYLLIDPPLTMEDEERWYRGVLGGTDITYTLETLEGVVIGNISLLELDKNNRRAALGVMIGEKSYQGRGIGTEAIGLMLRHAFEELDLVKVHLIVDVRNTRAQRCYAKCGFQKEGVLRMNRYKRGEFTDDIVMSILQKEWRSLNQ